MILDNLPQKAVAYDLDAGWLRRAEADAATFVEALAVRMEQSLPGHVRVSRKGGLLGLGRSRVHEIRVEIADFSYVLRLDGRQLVTSRARISRGVSLQSESMPLRGWVEALMAQVQHMASSNGDARDALQSFLLG